MKVTAVKTHKITTADTSIFSILDQYITNIQNKSVIAIASKVIAITQGRVVNMTEMDKEAYIKQAAQMYIPKEENRYGLFITINDNYLTYSAGIDESNVGAGVVLLPEHPQKVANTIREHLTEKFAVQYVGVIITDMAAIPLQKGIIAGPIAYSGFMPFKNITGTPDVFGRKFKYTWEGHLQGLAAAAGIVMGEGNEQTPIGIIEDIPFITFQDRNPIQEELDRLKIAPDEDMFGPMIKAAPWQKGGKSPQS